VLFDLREGFEADRKEKAPEELF